MAKGKAKKPEAAGPPKGAATETGQEKQQDKAPGKGGSDGPAAAAADGEVVISAPLHCEGCARKLRRSLQRLDGVGEVSVDCWTNTVVVSGQKAVENTTEVMEIVERKTRKKALLLSPSPEKLPLSAVKGAQTKVYEDEDVTVDDHMEMVVVLRINLHCDACCDEIKRRVLKIGGVEEAVPHLKSSQVMVKGMVEPATLVGFIHKCTGRKAAIIRAEPLDTPPTSKAPLPPMDAPLMEEHPSDNQEENQKGEKQENKGEVQEENRGGGDVEDNEKIQMEKPSDHDGVEKQETHDEAPNKQNDQKHDHLFEAHGSAAIVAVAPESEKMSMTNLYPYYYYPPYAYAPPYQYQYPQPYPHAYNPAMYGFPDYQPETFGDENLNACTIV